MIFVKSDGSHDQVPFTFEMYETIWLDKLAGRTASEIARKLNIVAFTRDLKTGESGVDWDIRIVNERFNHIKRHFADMRHMKSCYGIL